MSPAAFREYLNRLNACPEAVEWAKGKSLFEAWRTCDRADWMLWLVARVDKIYTPRLRLAACACVRTALKYVPIGEDRPKLAIECAERYARGEATVGELAAAVAAAGEAAGAAAWAAGALQSARRAGWASRPGC